MMIKVYQKIEAMRQHFGWDKTDTKAFMVDALLEEAHELKEAMTLSEDEFKDELADVLMYAFSICIDEGYDIETLIETKIEKVMQREY